MYHPRVEVHAYPTSLTDASGSIATANTYQPIVAAQPTRQGFCFQNQDASASMTLRFGTGPTLVIPAGVLYESPAHGVPMDAISVKSASAGAAYSAWEW